MSSFRVLCVENAKTVKGEALGYLTGILYLAPSDASGIANVCPNASPGCRAACLYSAGRAALDPAIPAARIARTKRFFADRLNFLDDVARDIAAIVRKAKRDGLKPAIRLNGTSDLPWERIRMRDNRTLLEAFPRVRFYDYTKVPKRMDAFVKGHMPHNYSLTFSHSETNGTEALAVLANGGNVAVVFFTKKRDALPATFQGARVIDADAHDLRFLDPRGVVCGLRAKGDAKHDTSGFVQIGA